jgi:hypothetical protein
MSGVYAGIDPSDARMGTSWDAYGIDEIWKMVATEDGMDSHTQIAAWQLQVKLCEEQADQLEKAAAQLALRWPTTPGSASEVFLQQVTALATAMRQEVQSSTAVQEPLRRITEALVAARDEIGALRERHDQYAKTEQQQLIPRPLSMPGQVARQPSPPSGWRAEIDYMAREVMVKSDATVGSQARRLIIPPAFELRDARHDSIRVDPGDADPTTVSTPRALSVDDPVDRRQILLGNSPWSVDSLHVDDGEAMLTSDSGGLNDAAAASQRGAPAPVSSLRDGLGSSSGIVFTPSGVITVGNLGSGIYGRRSLPISPAGSVAPGVKVLSEAVAPQVGQGQAGESRGAAGSTPAGMAPMVPPPKSQQNLGAGQVSPGGRLGRRRGRGLPADPNDPWIVAEGVPAVILPCAEPIQHEPGPGVIGLNR